MEKLRHFQVYSDQNKGAFNMLVDKIWIEDNRIYFRIIENLYKKNQLRKEREPGVYSLDPNDLFSIRCKLYF